MIRSQIYQEHGVKIFGHRLIQILRDFYFSTKITKGTKTDCVPESSSVSSVIYVVKSLFSLTEARRTRREDLMRGFTIFILLYNWMQQSVLE